MLRNKIFPLILAILFTNFIFIANAHAQASTGCENKFMEGFASCRAATCRIKDPHSPRNIIHQIRGVNKDNKCEYIIKYIDRTKTLCEFNRDQMAEYKKLFGQVLQNPNNQIANDGVDRMLRESCTHVDNEEKIADEEAGAKYYTLGDRNYPYVYIDKICINKNHVDNIYMTTGKYGFTFKARAIKTFRDGSSPYGELNYSYEDFLSKSCANFTKDIFRFSEIEFDLPAIAPLIDKEKIESVVVKLYNPSMAISEEFTAPLDDTYRYIIAKKADSFSPATLKALQMKISSSGSDTFYRIEKSRERMTENVKPYVLLPKDDYKTRAQSTFALECDGSVNGPSCRTKWVWGADIVLSLENLPEDPVHYKELVDVVNQYIDDAYKQFNMQ